MVGQKAAVRHKADPARLDMAQVWSKAQAVIQVSLYLFLSLSLTLLFSHLSSEVCDH